MRVKFIFYLVAFTALIALQSCKDEEVIVPALTEEQYQCVNNELAAANWCSGDYVCIQDGTYFKAGAKQRVGGNWLGAPPCPTFVKTTDGAQWQFQGKCTCP